MNRANRLLWAFTVTNTAVIAAAVTERARQALHHRNEAHRAEQMRRHRPTLQGRPAGQPHQAAVNVTPAPGTMLVLLQDRCLASHRAAIVLSRLLHDDTGPLPWVLALAGTPHGLQPLRTVLGDHEDILVCTPDSLDDLPDPPHAIYLTTTGDRLDAPLHDPEPGLVRLFEACGSPEARTWFNHRCVSTQGLAEMGAANVATNR
ncbi:MAG: hypothetical protein M3Y35_01420 [Actinomycetota bacterium]|nr:hypothetical protein [Actinomycetota bacterium]